MDYIDGLVQDCSNSSELAMELLQSCTKPSIWALMPTVPRKAVKLNHSLVFNEEKFQQAVMFKCWEIMENADISSYFPIKCQHDKGECLVIEYLDFHLIAWITCEALAHHISRCAKHKTNGASEESIDLMNFRFGYKDVWMILCNLTQVKQLGFLSWYECKRFWFIMQ